MKKYMLFISMMLTTSLCFAATFEVAPEISHISYREKNLPVGNEIIDVKLDGVFYGLRGSLESKERIYLAIEGRYALGQVEYSGTGSLDGIDSYTHEIRGLVGVPFPKVIIYSGYGRRYLNDDMNGRFTSTGHIGYERESTYQYIPIGVKTSHRIPIKAEIDILLSGRQVSHFEKIGFTSDPIINKQDRGVGFKLSTEFSKSFGSFDVSLSPFIRTWKVQESKVSGGLVEPKNTSVEVGGSVAVRF